MVAHLWRSHGSSSPIVEAVSLFTSKQLAGGQRRLRFWPRLEELESRIQPTQSVSVSSYATASEPSTTGGFRLLRSGNFSEISQPLTVSYTISGTATPGDDYTALSGSASFAAFVSVKDISVVVIDDLIPEPGGETVTMTLQAGTGYTVGGPATVKILDNDAFPAPPPVVPCPVCPKPQIWPAKGMEANPVTEFSENPVRFWDGVLRFAQTDLESGGFGMPWGVTRTWSNDFSYSYVSNAPQGTVINQLPFIRKDGGTVVVITDANTAHYFDPSGYTTFTSRYFLQETLTQDTYGTTYTLTDTMGNVFTFNGFATTVTEALRGKFTGMTDAAGNTITVHYGSNNKPDYMERSGGGVTERYDFTYTSFGEKEEIASIKLKRNSVVIREVDYDYYTGAKEGTNDFNNPHNLKTATIKDGDGNTLDVSYYRYYDVNSSGDNAGLLKYFFSSKSYARLAAEVGDPLAASDEDAAPYADLYLEYDDSTDPFILVGDIAPKVTLEKVQGQGCSVCSAGLGTYTYEYSASSNSDGFNSWSRKCVETLPDGNEEIVYTNYAGEVMLRSFKNTTTDEEWITYYKYDDAGRLLWTANPSAVSGYDEQYADLVHDQSGNFEFLRDGAGVIEVRTYYTSTTATSSSAGGIAGFYQKTELKHGETGTAILQEQVDYYTRNSFGIPASDTVYRNSDGTGGETTSFAYTFFGSTAAVESLTVTLPTVSSAQNGPGSADQVKTYFDSWGRPIWTKDGDGFLHYTEYDMGTGAVTKTIVDVDSSEIGDFSNKPSGWTTPTGGGLHLITQFEVDGMGRPTKITSPGGRIDYIVYNDIDHEERIYAAWNSGNDAPTGPTQVIRADYANGYTETLTMSATPGVTSGRPDGTETIDDLETLSRRYTNTAWQVTYQDDYFDLSGLTYSTSTSLGTEGTNFYRTQFGYDELGRQDRVESPTGTIYRTVSDFLGRIVSQWVGTDDTPAMGEWSPDNNTSPSNMIQVAAYAYDNGAIGDGNLTEMTLYPGGSAADRVTDYFYDWRNRLVAMKAGVEGSESTSLNRPITYLEYDNLDQRTAAELYDGDNVSITDGNSDGVPDKPSSSLLRARSTASYDDQGRVYRTQTFSVDPSSGSVSTYALTTNIWYGHRGQILKTTAPGLSSPLSPLGRGVGGEGLSLAAKTTYDGALRPTIVYLTDGGGDTGWSDADDVSGDAVLQQTENTYDADGNVLLVTLRERFHDETATGALGDPSTSPHARVSYVVYYYDLADRLTDTVNVGTNGGSTYTRPSSVPSRSDTVLVTSQAYNTAGWVSSTTDPRGIESRIEYDNLGRTTKTIEAYDDGTPDGGSDKTTEYGYDGSGHVVTVTAWVNDTDYETTQFVYGVTTSTSDIDSNDILAEVRHPDKSTGDPSTSEKDVYTVNALGQIKTAEDRNGNVHTYSFDVVGRMTADAVTTLGSGVDGAIRRVEVAYDTAGNPYLFTTYDAASSGNIVNQVQRAFNGLGQLTAEYQEHSGAVNTSTSPVVQYAYSEMPSGANHSRLVSMTYPDGRELDYNYASGLDNTISRLSSISSDSTTLEALSYLGLGTVVVRAHPEPGIDLTYIGTPGDAGDQYAGLDRFGRVVKQLWTDGLTATDDFRYGYDRDSNRLYRQNALDAAFSELYHANGASNGYHNLNQLTDFRRGTLSDANSDGVPDTVSTATRSQGWTLDGQGNWTSLDTDGTPVSRSHNLQNQVTEVGSNSLAFDSNGNMTTDESGHVLFFDAWNRLVRVQDSEENVLAEYSYDGLGRRIIEIHGTDQHDLYFSAAWQVLEQRDSDETHYSQYIWSPVYVDAMILRDRQIVGLGNYDRVYVQQDANFNVTALLDDTGAVIERLVYDPFGSPTFIAADWSGQDTDSVNWVYMHQGGRYDFVIGLYNFRNRDLSPTLGRWIQNDPLGFGAGDSNFYRDVTNNPTLFLDPLGLWPDPVLAGVGGVGAIGGGGGILSWIRPVGSAGAKFIPGIGWVLAGIDAMLFWEYWLQTHPPQAPRPVGGMQQPPQIGPGPFNGGNGGFGGQGGFGTQGGFGGGFRPGGMGGFQGGGFSGGGFGSQGGGFGGGGVIGPGFPLNPASGAAAAGTALAGLSAVTILAMAKGRQNIRNDYLDRVRRAAGPCLTHDQLCAMLQAAYEAARQARDMKLAREIQLAQKAAGCRRTHYGRR